MANNESDRELVFTRVFDAPRELVFDAWTHRNHIEQWWGPNGFTTTTSEMDVRPGGTWRYVMHGPDGTDYPNIIKYREVVRPERLHYWHGDDGTEAPVSFLVTVTFDDEDDKTRVTMRMLFDSKEKKDEVEQSYGAIEGAHQTLGRLEELLKTLRR